MRKESKKRLKAGQNNNDSPNNDNSRNNGNGLNVGNGADSDDLTELQTRLARLEQLHLSQSNSNNDVYKFVFFFIMGILLTILVYPNISRIINANGDSNIAVNNAQTEHHTVAFIKESDKLVDAGEVDNTQSKNSIHRSNKNNSDDKNAELKNVVGDEETSKYVDKSIQDKDTTEVAGETVDTLGSFGDLMEVEIEELAAEDTDTEKTEGKHDTVAEGRPKKETTKAKHEVHDDTDPDGEEVKLYREEINTEPESQNTKSTKGQGKSRVENNSKSDAQKPNKQIQKGNQTGKQKVKKGEKKSAPNNGNKNADLPDEIKNFKPTYLKETKPKKVFVDGRRIPPTELLPQKPNNSSVKIWMFEEFLSDAECDGLRRVHNKHVQEQSKHDPILCFDSISTLRKHLKQAGKSVKVSPKDFTQGTKCVNASFSSQLKTWLNGNWSYSTAFYPGESPFATAFENRVKEAMGLSPENGGKFQITSYPLHIGYKEHTDCTQTKDKRDRVATVLVYLDTVAEGGETEFPELGVWARPRKGRALMWNNMNTDGDCEPLSIHRANKVLDGHKFILQRWYYYQSFYSLGKRPPEPQLPARHPGQPRVSCDEYEHGSCRWYDEWNFDHMIEYERQKYTLV